MGFASLCVCSVIKYEFIQEKQQNGEKFSKRLIFEFEETLKKESQSEENGNLWVVLAAGSESWYNYRHQADICHAYQIVKRHGVPDDRVVVFMKDDIAYNPLNKNQGVIINRPGGPDVYKGVPKDYTGNNLNASIFLDVLAGKDILTGSRKTLKTGPNDRIFIYFADHGGPGVSMFGRGLLHATNLTNTIIQMHNQNKFKEMVIYWESCHSGSMFQNLLPNNINVYALSASSPDQESYACYDDKKLRNYLGDCFSVHWMEDADIEDLNGESLLTQYLITKYRTNTSTVEQWGSSLQMDDEKVGSYLGSEDFGGQNYFDFMSSKVRLSNQIHPVKQSDVALQVQIMQLNGATSLEDNMNLETKINDLITKRITLKETINKIVSSAVSIEFGVPDGPDSKIPDSISNQIKESSKIPTTRETLENCFYPALKIFHDNCFKMTCNDYAIYQVKRLLPLCKRSVLSLDSLRKSMKAHCKFEKPICGIY